MNEDQTKTPRDAQAEIKALVPADIRAAFLAGALSAKAFDLLTATRPLTPLERTAKLSAAAKVALWKHRAASRQARTEALSNTERQHRHVDKHAAIDAKLEAARAGINWERRRNAETSLLNWIETYLKDAPPSARLFKYTPSARLAEAVRLAESAVAQNAFPWHIRIARGFGKSTIAEAAVAFALATGRKSFAVFVSAKTDDAVQLVEDVFSIFAGGETFAEDYPDIAFPIRLLNGSWRRHITYAGRSVAFVKTHAKVVLPYLVNADGTPTIGAGAVLTARGFEGRVRGMKHGARRPDLLVLDDLQTDKDACNEETVAKAVAKVRQSFLNLGGREKLSILMTSTPIACDDLSETFAADPAWKTTTFRAFEQWPHDWSAHGRDGLWGEYRRIYERALLAGDGTTARAAANAFYLANRAAMDAGAEVLDENRFDSSVELSAVQALMDTLFNNGDAAFDAEQQMTPRRQQFAFELTPQVVLQRVRAGIEPGALVKDAVFTCAATDINPSYALSTVIVSFDVHRTALVAAYHKTPLKISDRVNDTAYHAKVYSALAAHVREVNDICTRSNVKLDAFGIDAGGKQFDPVTQFASEAESTAGLKVTAMTGRAGQTWNPFVKSRIRAPLNETVFCRGQRGAVWLAFNADAHKESAQKALGTETGAPGGMTLFDGGVDHTDFALQVTNERLLEKKARPDGRMLYRWRTREPHDYLDCLAMCYALAGANGIGAGGEIVATSTRKKAVCL